MGSAVIAARHCEGATAPEAISSEITQRLLAPRSIALIGASSDPKRTSARAQIYLRKHGFTGALHPVNPRADTVLDEKAYPTLRDVPGPIDLAYILTGTAHVEQAIQDCATVKIPVAAILADGFAESGPDGAQRQSHIATLARDANLRLLGPNSMAVINIPARIACSVNAALEAPELIPGNWSLVSQSGSVMGTLLSRAAARGFGFAKLVSMGNEADLTAGEIALMLADDPETAAILLFLETIRCPDLLAQAAARAHQQGKPIVAYKLGRSEAGAVLAATHTGALAGSDAAANAFFRAHGIIRVDHIEALLELPPLVIGRRPPPAPKRSVRVVTTTGGGGAMVVDRLGLTGIATAKMLDTTLAGMGKDAITNALTDARNDENTDLAIAVIGSSAQFRPQDAVSGIAASTGINPVCAFIVPHAEESLKLLGAAGIAAFRNPEPCADAIRAYCEWHTPNPPIPTNDTTKATALLPRATDEAGARAIFAALGIPDTARLIDPFAPPDLDYPVALKAVSSEIAHKTEAGAVALNIADAQTLTARARDMRGRLGPQITGFLVQPMAHGLAEAILGYRLDPTVGPVIALGAGGILAELYRDVTLRLAPITEPEAMDMIREVKGLAPILGYRNLPRGDAPALARAVAAFSRLAGIPAVIEAEINPMIILRDGVVMADALLRSAP